MSPPAATEPVRASHPRRLTLLRALGALVGVALAGVTAVRGGAPGFLERGLYDQAVSRLLPEVPRSADLVLVEVDDRALAALGERWPLSRATWARAFRALAAQRPAAVAVDIIFDQPGSRDALELGEDVLEALRASGLAEQPAGAALAADLEAKLHARDGDARLAEALSEGGGVILGAAALTDDVPAMTPLDDDGALGTPLSLAGTTPRLQARSMAGSIAPLRMAARGSGTLNMLVDGDGVIRRYPYVVDVGGRTWPSLALATALYLMPERAESLMALAATDEGAPLMRLPSPDWMPRVSLADVLHADPGSVGLDLALRGKTVFVGVTAMGLHGQSTLPGQVAVPGVEIHAFALDNLRSYRLLRSSGLVAGAGVLETAVVLLAFALLGRRARTLGGVLWAALSLGLVHLALVGWLAADVGWVLPLLPAWAGLGLMLAVDAVARGEELGRQRDALRRLFVRYPQGASGSLAAPVPPEPPPGSGQ
ncbi:CHASE2 domain-containing protein [Pyxidicoccus fallax]|uniref:CHASE2 domain-containing protein n=1 Tax=Pyxidicoccus fallax TaxID=394095 RepID=A0A848LHN0_9BACT|nr:CHASE2 domain-containing protein [Pyxidicoccus fallax]NMO16168.1 CHASE2 domain-containing protein [Pyxidicoccus fallax]NPC78691.1 CHASE2 domain-containing protein [Pyxidicoccus fallax]